MSDDHQRRPYRPGVGVMLLSRDNRVFVAQRFDMSGDAWQMPQGGIDEGETPEAAARRELLEETSIANVEVLARTEDWLSYDLPEELRGKVWDGRYRGQTQIWFLMRYLGTDSDIDLDTKHPEFKAWKWAGLDELVDLIVGFKRPLYRELVATFGERIKG